MATFPAAETGILLRSAAHDRFARPGGIELAIGLARGCRVITVSSGRLKTISGWLRTSLVVIVISRFCFRRM
jgi:hypothetical protein